jgi:ubiquinone/menaquinone biosynthesis C-methylase UbiE
MLGCMVSRSSRHRLFAALWDRATAHETASMQRARSQVVGHASGRVLELGTGVGTNWQFLPADIQYIGLEPDPSMAGRANRHAAEQRRSLALIQARAEDLPIAGNSVDTIVVTLSLCSVSDLTAALSEAKRVLKPGGELRFWEHVRPNGAAARLFDLLTPVWRRVGAGCILNRRTAEAIEAAGFQVHLDRRFTMAGLPMVLGVATKPAGGPP